MFIKYLPIILAIVLYGLIYFIRLQPALVEPENRANSNEQNFLKLELFPKLRESLDQKIQLFLPSPQAQLLSGIVLGNKKDLPAELKLALRDTATLHIVVVSGQNLTILAYFVMLLAGILKRKLALFLTMLVIIFYTLLTGGQIPVLRAAIMAGLSFGAQFFGRLRDGVWILILTAGLMLLINPLWITELSFQLSFLATVGVIVVSPILLSVFKGWPEVIKADLAVTIASQLMVLPIIAENFHQLSLVSVITNLLVLWTIPLVMIVGVINLILSLIWLPLAVLFAPLTHILLTYFVYVVQFFASLPFSWEYIGEMGWMVWAGYYFILTAVILTLNVKAQMPNVKENLNV